MKFEFFKILYCVRDQQRIIVYEMAEVAKPWTHSESLVQPPGLFES